MLTSTGPWTRGSNAMESKPIYLSKTFWAGVLSVAGAIGQLIKPEPDVNLAYTLFIAGLALVGIRQAID